MSSLTPSSSPDRKIVSSEADHLKQVPPPVEVAPRAESPFAEVAVPTLASVKLDPGLKVFESALERMHAGPLYCTFQERLRELKSPLDPDRDRKASQAVAAFEMLPLEEKVETLNTMLSVERLAQRASWPIPGAPQFKVPSVEHRSVAEQQMNELARNLLERGALSIDYAQRVAQSILENFPPSVEISKRLALLGGAAALSIALFVATPLWAAVPVAVGACAFAWSRLKQPTVHGEYVQGYVSESLDSMLQIFLGGAAPLEVTLGAYYNQATHLSELHKDAFLISRALRVLGWPAENISKAFQNPYPVTSAGNVLVPAIVQAFAEHGVTVRSPLFVASENMADKENEDLIQFLDLMNVAHFLWAARDREKLRGEMADIVLRSHGAGKPEAA
mgnify:CR=1 FL=1